MHAFEDALSEGKTGLSSKTTIENFGEILKYVKIENENGI